ncbi:zinc finger BED domain-containing protein RICESLEEPER 2 [Spinacia oleracea]|uniref:Zinc finger BED domain-containing protein RICESLEEPER 2 n=1 Tax=Spinacia oleracea TaxID=3562 RepID=A0ABM3QGF9_SPIOL|nr:zinc finger BED domain-containing protein RICESLEEPER 2-like [Spinacia oleracea]
MEATMDPKSMNIEGADPEVEILSKPNREKGKKLCHTYKPASSTQSNGGQSISNLNSGGLNVVAGDGFMEEFDSFSGGEFTGIPKSELALYLEEPRVPRANNLDIIDYWRSCQLRFPVLSVMARDLLSIPISTVASESAFSVGGKILDPVRSSLKSSVVESLICLRDWTYGHQAETVPELEELCDNVMSLKLDVDIYFSSHYYSKSSFCQWK